MVKAHSPLKSSFHLCLVHNMFRYHLFNEINCVILLLAFILFLSANARNVVVVNTDSIIKIIVLFNGQ